jgi:dTDP-4-dehydrorhamnose 3,5-epimerase
MKVTRLAIPDVCLIEPQAFGDTRGFLLVSWQDDVFRREVTDVAFVQDNQSRSKKGTLRGLHYQKEYTQGKLVRCAVGRIWDVAVDVRRASPSFGRWVAAELSDENHHQLWIPPGFAHGFLVLSESADLQYKVTDRYHPASERTLRWDDATVGVTWPLPEGVAPLLSPKDAAGSSFVDLEALA